MQKSLLLAVPILGAAFLAAPSVAQAQVQFGIDRNGRPEIGIGDPDRDRYDRREYWRQRREEDRARAYEEGRREAWREGRYRRYGEDGYGDRCRTVIIQEENEWGRMITRRIRRCG